MYAISLDLGGTHIGCAIVRDRDVLAHTSIPANARAGLAPLLPHLHSTIDALLTEAGITAADCAGIAIGYPGIVDFRTGNILSTHKKYADAIHLDLAGWALENFALPIRMENDARMALLGEHFAGAAQGHDNVIMMTLGTGIGSGAMIHGHLLRGAHAQAGNLGGHLPVDFHGRHCTCGNIGCAEAEASGWALPLVARDWPGFSRSTLAGLPHISFKQLFDHAAHGDQVALAVQQHCLEVWASNAVANVHAYDPDIVVIGGGVVESAHLIIPFIQHHVDEHVWIGGFRPKILPAKLGNLAGLIGAVPLLSEEIAAAIL
jgi:glucokinase